MTVHDEMAESFPLIKPRPLVVRVVHVETGQVASEHEIPADMTGHELEQWARWLEANCGPDYTTEIPNWGNA